MSEYNSSTENDPVDIIFEPSQNDILRFPGDFVIDKLLLYPWNGADPIDVTNLRVTLNIFEDIFNNFLTGSLSLLDAWDFPMLYPLIGEEILEVKFKRPETKDATGNDTIYGGGAEQEVPESRTFSMKFRVIKMTNRSKARDRAQYYELHFISREMIKNKKTKVRRHYEDMLYSEMASHVYKKYLYIDKKLELEKTKYKQDFTVSCWSPSQAINIMASRSIPSTHVGSNYVFYETLKYFHYISIEELMTRDPRERLVYAWKDVWTEYLSRPINLESRSIDGYNFVEYFDVLSNLQHGMYKSTLYTFDLVRQQYKKVKFKYLSSYEDMVHLEDHPLCTEDLDAYDESFLSRVGLVMTNKKHDTIPWIAGKEPGIKPTKVEKYLLKRQSQFQQLNNIRITITVPGNPNRQVGDIIEFYCPNSLGVPTEFDNEPERYISGKYIITAIRHRFEIEGYSNDIEIAKDSYLHDFEYVNPIPIYYPTW